MPTVIGYHDVKDTDHWLASPKREEFGPLGVSSIRTFVDPTEPNSRRRADGRGGHGRTHGRDGDSGGEGSDGARRCPARDPRDPRRGVAVIWNGCRRRSALGRLKVSTSLM